MTQKIYYQDPFLTKCKAKIVEIRDNAIILDKTIAFPEGGGQEGDIGVFVLEDGSKIEFIDTQKSLGRSIYLDNFPIIQVDTDVLHYLKNREDIDKLKVGMEIEVKIDVQRRAILSAYHTATHLMLMAIEQWYCGYESNVYGCHIQTDKSRLDFRTQEKFNQEFIKEAESYCNELIAKALPIKTYQHPKENEAWYWECDEVVYPCGGTHLTNTSQLKGIRLKRKNLGKNGQRVSVEIDGICDEFLGLYHE